MIVRYGKTNAAYLEGKDFYLDPTTNSYWVAKALAASAKYAEQPRRERCVVCTARVGKPIFRYLGVEYALCTDCGHLNGLHEDTLEFSKFLYEQDQGGAAIVYDDDTVDSFMRRVRSIYLPKAQFLLDALRANGVDPTLLRYADLGAGGGHFVIALRECGITQSIGYEASAALVDRLNRRLGGDSLRVSRVEDTAKLAETAKAEVMTMIFSLEHVHDLIGFMSSLRRNKTFRYLYFAVPLFTPSALIDVAFPSLAPRVLGLGHTHLFSNRSIDVLCSRFGLKRVAEWWFGANAFDIMRNIALLLDQRPAMSEWVAQMKKVMDEMQLAFDHQKLSSEVHILAAIQD